MRPWVSDDRGCREDLLRGAIAGKTVDGPDLGPLQTEVELLVDWRYRKAKLLLDLGRREELQPEDPEVPGDFRGMLSREVEERGRERIEDHLVRHLQLADNPDDRGHDGFRLS